MRSTALDLKMIVSETQNALKGTMALNTYQRDSACKHFTNIP